MLYILNMVAAMHSRISDAKDRGATATEYALLVAFIAFAIILGVTFFGTQLSTWFQDLGSTVGGWAN